MSGLAIAPLLAKLSANKDNSKRNLFIGKVSDSDFDSLFPDRFGVFPKKNDQSYIGKLLYFLGNKGLIDKNYSPKFMLGSTRLAALKNYGKDAITLDKLETDDVIHLASGRRTEFGDLDVDVIIKADKNKIAEAINQLDPSTFSAKVSSDINIAIRVGDKVIQCDLVDISKSPEATQFLKKSGFLDLSSNVKGVFSIYLLRSVTTNMDINPSDALEAILQFANKNPTSSFSISLQKKLQNGYIPNKIRFSLGGEGLRLVLDISKDDKREKLDVDINPRADFKNLDALAQQILQDSTATSSDI